MSSFSESAFSTDAFSVDAFDIDSSVVAEVFILPVAAKSATMFRVSSHALTVSDTGYFSVRIFKS